MKRITIYFLVLILGILPGYFVIFNSVFTDTSGSISERLLTFLLVVICYSIPGAVLGYIGPATSWKWSIWLTIPAFLIILLYSFKEPDLLVLNFGYILLAFASGSIGGYFGASIALRGKTRK